MTNKTDDATASLAIPTAENTKETKQILVTGGTGLVGSHLINQLTKEGKQVKAIFRNTIPALEQPERVTWIKCDILDVIALEEALKGIEEVYHCAAIVSFNAKKKHELFQTNIEGTANVVNAALNAGTKKLCYISSVAALGRTKNGSETNEQMAWNEENNTSNYGKSKYLAEVEVWRGIAEGLHAVIVNPSIILGAGNWNEGSTKIFKTAYNEFPWYTNGATGFVDVEDVATAMIRLMDSDISGERFILNGANRPYKDVFTLIANAFAKKEPLKKVSPLLAGLVWRADVIRSWVTGEEPLLTKETAEAAQSVHLYNNSKLTKFLPSFAYTSIEETIGRICGELKEKYKLS